MPAMTAGGSPSIAVVRDSSVVRPPRLPSLRSAVVADRTAPPAAPSAASGVTDPIVESIASVCFSVSELLVPSSISATLFGVDEPHTIAHARLE